MNFKSRTGRTYKIRINQRPKERITAYFNKIIKEKVLVTGLASVFAISLIAPFVAIPANADRNNSTSSVKIVFDKNASIVDVVKPAPVITPGQSAQDIADQAAAEIAAAQAAAAVKQKLQKAVSTRTKVYNDPSDFNAIYNTAGAAYGIDPRILHAVHYVETGASGSTSKRNPSGATGPMQFIPSTWRHYAVDGNGDGNTDITNVVDAIYTAAHYLSASGGSVNGYKTALWSYNPSSYYYSKVMSVAQSLGY
ncbi:MAG: lytic transglycosylase domain-containing protein [Candidatus Berkelbacteria bacterium]|nr:lytic transglycosylase domain-containing protein [Candidatus Berkelbacteria bacterium]